VSKVAKRQVIQSKRGKKNWLAVTRGAWDRGHTKGKGGSGKKSENIIYFEFGLKKEVQKLKSGGREVSRALKTPFNDVLPLCTKGRQVLSGKTLTRKSKTNVTKTGSLLSVSGRSEARI